MRQPGRRGVVPRETPLESGLHGLDAVGPSLLVVGGSSLPATEVLGSASAIMPTSSRSNVRQSRQDTHRQASSRPNRKVGIRGGRRLTTGRWSSCSESRSTRLPFGAAGVPPAGAAPAVYCFSATASLSASPERRSGGAGRPPRGRRQKSATLAITEVEYSRGSWAGCQHASRSVRCACLRPGAVRIRVGLTRRRLLCKSVCAHDF